MEDEITAEWLQMYELAKKYFILHGNINIIINSDNEETKKLYDWIANERYKYNNTTLNPEKIELLEMLNINWNIYDYQTTPNIHEQVKLDISEPPKVEEITDIINDNPDINPNWLQMYIVAKRYYMKYGNLLIPTINNERYKLDQNGCKFTAWITNQRQLYKSRKLSSKKIKLLEDIGIIWNIQDYKRTERWKEERIVLPVPDIPKIEEIIDVIHDYPNINPSWLQMYITAKRYYLQYGNLAVPSTFNTTYYIGKNGIKLSNWISTQRQQYRKRKLSEEKIKLLEDIGMIWNAQKYRYTK